MSITDQWCREGDGAKCGQPRRRLLMAVRNTGHRALPIGHTQRTPGVKPGQNKWPAGRLRDHAGYRSRLSRRRERVDRPVSPFPRFPNAEIARLYDPSRQRMPLDAVPAPLEDRARLEPRPLISLHLRNGYKSEDWVGFGKTVRTLNAWMLKQHALDSLWVHKPAAAPKNPIRSTQEANRVGPIERDEVVCLEEAYAFSPLYPPVWVMYPKNIDGPRRASLPAEGANCWDSGTGSIRHSTWG